MLTLGGESWRSAVGLQGMQYGVDLSRTEYRLLE